jgi:NAD(P)-dependent dehydrogenase (short-subunit alcohol dehydrogenase family)
MTPEKMLHNLMDVNLFGMVRVTQAFLPLVRKAQGRIVNMSSLAGKLFSIGLK